jgi:hypothetical protein
MLTQIPGHLVVDAMSRHETTGREATGYVIRSIVDPPPQVFQARIFGWSATGRGFW